jgi:D-glycero-D-manno-heptose 1,7-bisphosphate phosphatase
MKFEQPRALLLDRDGVINREISYLYRIQDFEFLPGVIGACRRFQDAGYLLIIITNQAGIARGYYSETDFHVLNDWMIDQFKKSGVWLARVLYSPFHPDGLGQYRRDSFCRKPNPGLILQAQKEYDLDLPLSILVGDKESDIEAGLAAKVGKCILVRSGCPIDESATKAHAVMNSLAELRPF